MLGPNDWRYFALARLVICVGAALPSPSLFRSIRAYVRAALDLRVLLWTLVLPALWLTLRSDLLPPVSLRQHGVSAKICDTAYISSVLGVLFIDSFAAAVPSAAGLPDGFRIEQQLLSEYSVSAPPRLLASLRRRIYVSLELGLLLVAPLLAIISLILAAQCDEHSLMQASLRLPATRHPRRRHRSFISNRRSSHHRGRPARSYNRAGTPTPPWAATANEPRRGRHTTRATNTRAGEREQCELLSRGPPHSDHAACTTLRLGSRPRRRRQRQRDRPRGGACRSGRFSRPRQDLLPAAHLCATPSHTPRVACPRPTLTHVPPLVRGYPRGCYHDCRVTFTLPTFGAPQAPAPLLWSAICATVAIGACRVGRLTISACAGALCIIDNNTGSRRNTRNRDTTENTAERPREHAINGGPSIAIQTPSEEDLSTAQRIMTPSRVARSSAPQTPVPVAAAPSHTPAQSQRTRGRYSDGFSPLPPPPTTTMPVVMRRRLRRHAAIYSVRCTLKSKRPQQLPMLVRRMAWSNHE